VAAAHVIAPRHLPPTEMSLLRTNVTAERTQMPRSADTYVEPVLRHDAPARKRPLVVLSPTYYALFGGVALASWTIGGLTNLFGVAAALCGFVAAVSSGPGMLRAPVLATFDGWARRRARARRTRRLRRAARVGRCFRWLEFLPSVVFAVSLVGLPGAGVAAVLGRPWATFLALPLAGLMVSVFLAFHIVVAKNLFAMRLGDVPTGPMRFYKTAAVAVWLEERDSRRHNVQLVSAVLALIFGLLAALVA
jgi:hypothetical protein